MIILTAGWCANSGLKTFAGLMQARIRFVIDAIVTAGLLAAGVLFVLTSRGSRGDLLAISLIAGWFFVSVAVVTYIFRAALYTKRHRSDFWTDVSCLNFGIALFGVSAVGFADQLLPAYVLVAVAAVTFVLVVERSSLAKHRFAPTSLIGFVLLAMLFPLHIALLACEFAGLGASTLFIAARIAAKGT